MFATATTSDGVSLSSMTTSVRSNRTSSHHVQAPTHSVQQSSTSPLPLSATSQRTLYYVVAGGLAGMVEHISMFPLDTVKTRLQAEAYPISIRECMINTFREGGVPAFYRGVAAGAFGSFPSHAAYFTIYETLKANLQQSPQFTEESSTISHSRRRWWDLSSYNLPLPVTAALAGAGATIGHDCCHTPFDVVKQRLQMSPAGSTLFGTFRTMIAREGVGALYLSLPTTLIMNIPFSASYFATYESMKKLLHASEEELEQSFWKYAVSGGLSGAIAGVLSNPFDVIKTRQQLGKLKTGPGLMKAFRAAFLAEGVNIFTRGVRARVLYYIPSAAVQMTSYECVKWLLKRTSLYSPNLPAPSLSEMH